MKKNLTILFAALLALAWISAISDAVSRPQKIKEHLANAQEFEKKGIYVDAIAEYEQALSYRSGDIEISLKMAEDYLHTGSSKKFTDICKRLAEDDQKDTRALDRLMNYYVDNKEESSAVKYLKEFTELYPKNKNAQEWMQKLKGSYQILYCRYEELGPIVSETMVVRNEEQYGITDSLGVEILPAEYEELYPYSEKELALAKKDGKYIYVDKDAQTRLVPDKQYQKLGLICKDGTIAKSGDKYGYLDDQLNPVTEFTWDQLSLLHKSVGAGCRDGKWQLLDSKGEPRAETVYKDVILDEQGFCSLQGRIFAKTGKQYHIVDKKGKQVGELGFEDARAFSEKGDAAVCMNGKWGFVNQKGELTIECGYEQADSFCNGFAAVCVDGKWGYLDEKGHLSVEPRFEKVTRISKEGTAAVLFDGEWLLIRLNAFI